jgi:hypothetical protein
LKTISDAPARVSQRIARHDAIGIEKIAQGLVLNVKPTAEMPRQSTALAKPKAKRRSG